MTVVTTVISRHCIANATDSFLTVDRGDGTFEVDKNRGRQPKLVAIPHFKGAASYFGLGEIGGWSTYRWLKVKAGKARGYGSFEDYVNHLRDDLEVELRARRLADMGIGIHVSGYEYLDGYWIPELFVISNYEDIAYTKLCCLHVTREAFRPISGEEATKPYSTQQHGDLETWKRVYAWLREDGEEDRILIFNNGDPLLFNPVAAAAISAVNVLGVRGRVERNDPLKRYSAIVRSAVQGVVNLQRELCPRGKRVVGGRIHDYVVSPVREYTKSRLRV